MQITINAMAISTITSASDITVDLAKFGVPTTISERSVNISDEDTGAYVGEPNSVTVNGTKVTLALYARFPGSGSSDRAGDISGPYTITIKQSAGVTNPIRPERPPSR